MPAARPAAGQPVPTGEWLGGIDLRGKPGKGNSRPAPRRLSCDGRGVRLLNGAPVEPDADGCCVGLKGAGDTFALCMTEPTTSGIIAIPENGEFAWSFTCDRHAAVLDSPRPLTSDDVHEINRRRRGAISGGP